MTRTESEHKYRAAQWKLYYEAHSVEMKAYYRAKSHCRRALGWDSNRKAVKAPILSVLAEAKFGDKYLDAYSGQLIDVPTIDHIEALSLGGSNEPENLCITSFANNHSKSDLPLIIWMARIACRNM